MSHFMLDHLMGNFKFFGKTASTAALPGGAHYLDSSQAATNAKARPAR